MTVENTTQAIITIKNLWAGYETEPVLQDINLDVQRGDFLGIIGPNGGGKTTLLRVMLGLITPQRGEINILGQPPLQGRAQIGYVPQNIAFDKSFPVSVRDVVCMGRLAKGRLFKRMMPEDEAIVDETLQWVALKAFAQRAVGDLSGGQRQRVYIARALATRPQILLLDEPTASLDAESSTSLYELLARLNESVTILLISHDLTAVSKYVKTIGCLNRRLHYHREKQLTVDMLQQSYGCAVDLIAHGVPHRVFSDHAAKGDHPHD